MDIHLTNFRCWKTKSININPNSFTLIHGESGKGKSSILESIYFVLTGKGRNIISEGQKSCVVEIKFNNITVKRKRKPNVLEVTTTEGKKYLDSAGQGYIDKIFTPYFGLVGYLRQNKIENFALMSPSEKLLFLEKLAFYGIDIFKIKNKTYEILKNNEKDLISNSTKIDLTQEQLQNIDPKLFENIKYPDNCDEIKEKKIFAKYDEYNRKISEVSDKLEGLTKEIKKIEIIDIKLESQNKILDDYKNKREQNITKLDKYSDTDINQNIKETENKLNSIKKNQKLRNLVEINNNNIEKLKELKKEEDLELKRKIVVISGKLWDEAPHDKVLNEKTKLEENLEYFKKYFNIKKKKDEINFKYEYLNKEKEKLSKYNNAIEYYQNRLKISKIYNCPSCSSDLYINDEDNLQVSEKNYIEEDKEVMDQKIIKLEMKRDKTLQICKYLENKEIQLNYLLDEQKKIPVKSKRPEIVDEIKEKICNLNEYIDRNLSLETKLSDYKHKKENNIYSDRVIFLEMDINNNNSKIESLKIEDFDPDLDEEKLQKYLKELNKRKYYIDTITENVNELDRTIEEIERKVYNIEIEKGGKSIDRLYREINHYKMQTTKLKNRLDKIESLKNQIDIFNIYKPQITNYTKLLTNYETYKNNEGISKEKLNSIRKLRTIINEAESKCLSSFISSLESSVQLYLDDFFNSDSMIISIKKYKQIKKIEKPAIHIILDYKGRECDPLSLSGGELQRVIMAFSLAITDKFNLPFVLLDESMSNLDQELTSQIIDSIRKYQNNKIIVLIAHQVVLGIFDQVIKI